MKKQRGTLRRPQTDDDKLEAWLEGDRMRAVWAAEWAAEARARQRNCEAQENCKLSAAECQADLVRRGFAPRPRPLPKAEIVNLPRLGFWARFRWISRMFWARDVPPR